MIKEAEDKLLEIFEAQYGFSPDYLSIDFILKAVNATYVNKYFSHYLEVGEEIWEQNKENYNLNDPYQIYHYDSEMITDALSNERIHNSNDIKKEQQ